MKKARIPLMMKELHASPRHNTSLSGIIVKTL